MIAIPDPDEFADQMLQCIERNTTHGSLDNEDCHYAMDGVMCDLLEQLGYKKGIEIFKSTPKWYA